MSAVKERLSHLGVFSSLQVHCVLEASLQEGGVCMRGGCTGRMKEVERR